MDTLSIIIEHLKTLPPNFYGEVVVRIRQGKPVLLEENRTIKLEKEDSEQRYKG